MKKIREKIAKAKSAISIKTYKRPMVFVIAMMVSINIIILLVAAFIAVLIDDSFTSFIDAFANGSVKWMLTPNAILAIDNPSTLVLAVIVLITGLVLFSGTIIALTTNAIKEYFQKKQSGSGKVYLENHIVILNWNNKVPELVADLLHVDRKNVTVMILAEIDKSTAEKQIQSAIASYKNVEVDFSKLNVLVKGGDPLSHKDLSDICIEQATAILIMSKETHEVILKDLSKSDLNVIKTLLNLGTVPLDPKVEIVAEIKKFETKAKIITMCNVVHTLQSKMVLPICFDRRLGQIIAQTIIDHRIEDVYLSLFSYEGSEIYTVKNVGFLDYLSQYSYGIPIGKDPNHLYVLAPSNKKKLMQAPIPIEFPTIKGKKFVEKTELKVFIFGNNNKLPFMLESFEDYKRIHKSTFNAIWVKDEDLEQTLKEINESDNNVTLVLLSDENQQSDSLDANVIDLLIYLETHVTNKNIHIIVELLDPKNDYIIKDFRIRNTIISNKIISLLLSKLAMFQETAPFYENLLTIAPREQFDDDQSVTIHPAYNCFNESFPLAFSSKKAFIGAAFFSQNQKAIPIGLEKNGEIIIFEGDLHSNESIQIDEQDAIVWMRL